MTQDKAKRLMELRQKITEVEQVAAPLKLERDAIQHDLLEELKADGEFSVRYDFGTFTRAVRKTPQVVDEPKVIAWLKKNKLYKEYTAVRLAPHFDGLLKEAAKEGKQIDGVETRETEYMSVTTPKEGDKRKVAVE